MHTISGESLLETILQKSPLTFKVLTDNGLELCCFEKNLTLGQACLNHQVSILPILADLIKLALPRKAPNVLPENLTQIVQLLEDDHHYYLTTLIPQIRLLLQKLNTETKTIYSEALQELSAILPEFLAEITHHVLMESDELFPYIKDLDSYQHNKISLSVVAKQFAFRSVCSLNDSEYRTGYFFEQFRKILFDYEITNQTPLMVSILINTLKHFECHILQHENIEDLHLLPRALEIENLCREQINSQTGKK